MNDPLKDRLSRLSAEKRALLARKIFRGRTSPGGAARPSVALRPRPAERYDPFPLTDLQQAYWVGRSSAFALGGVAGHSYLELESSGLDLEHLGAAWRRLVDRHDMLRAVVLPDGQQQVLREVPPYEVAEVDLSGENPRTAEARLAEIRSSLSHQVLPSERWPLFDIRALRLPGGRLRLLVSLDALFIDAWSMVVLFREWHELYRDPAARLPLLEVSFRDYVLAEAELGRSEEHERAAAYWRGRLPTLPAGPDLPLARSLESITAPRFVRRAAELDPDLWGRLKSRAARGGLTPTGVLLAAYAGVLAVWCGSSRFTVNVPRFNRPPLHPQVNDIVGELASFTVLEVDHDRAEAFEVRGKRLQARLWEDLEHAAFGGVKILREMARLRGSSSQALAPVVFTSAPEDPHKKGASLLGALEAFGEVVHSINQTPQVLLDNHISEHAGRLVSHWDSVDEALPDGLPEAMRSAFLSHLRRLADDEAAWHEPWFETARRLVPEADRALERASHGAEVAVPEVRIQDLFERRASAHPALAAVRSQRRSLSYGELLALSRRWARRLRELGADPRRPVAIVMEKGWEQVVAALAALGAGAPYLPIDASVPRERLWHLLEQGLSGIVLTQSWLEKEIVWPESVRRLAVDRDEAVEGVPDLPLEAVGTPDDLAYVLFTSGSTGAPKGAMIAHRGVVNAILETNRTFGVCSKDRVLALTALHHDMSLFDIFGVLAAGGTVVLPEAWGARDPAHWLDLLEGQGVTIWNSVPAMMEMLLECLETRPGASLPRLRLAFLGGDWIQVSLPRRLAPVAPGARVVSVGGPTETTLWNIWYPLASVEPTWKSIPYGRPIANTRYHVLNEALESCPVWVPGELCCAGVGLAKGYWRDEELTQAKFIAHPRTGERLYRTGDMGRRLPDGNLEILGRLDSQVKLQGQRIELGEIEATLGRHAGVRSSVAAVAPDGKGGKRLVAYVVPQGSPPAARDLEEFLRAALPRHMVPGAFVLLERLPLTPNGKVDRRALPPPTDSAGAPGGGADAGGSLGGGGEKPGPAEAAPAGAVLERIRRIVAGVLKVEGVEAGANLLSLGVTSIDMVRIGNQLEKAFGHRPRMDELFRLQTAAALARHYEGRGDGMRGIDSPLQAAGGRLQQYLASFKVLSDPAEREAFKRSQPGLRRDERVRSPIPLTPLERTEERRRRWSERRSHRSFSLKPVPFECLGRLLSCVEQLTLDGKPKYVYGSPGGLYPSQVYLHLKAGRVEGLRGGVYYYHPVEHALALLTPDVEIDRGIHVPFINTPTFDEAAFSIFIIAQMRAIAPSYGELSLHFVTIEAGLIAQLLEMEAPSCGIGLCQIGSLQFDRIRPWFHLDAGHVLVHSLLGGRVDNPVPAEAPAAAAKEGAARLAKMLERVKMLSPEEARALLDANRKAGGPDE